MTRPPGISGTGTRVAAARGARMRAALLLGGGFALALAMSACASRDAPPTHFGPWGAVHSLQEPDRSILIAAIAALTGDNGKSVVLARYAGDVHRRLDLASLSNEVPVAVDAGGRLGPIDEVSSKYRARVFETDFPRKTTILELSAPKRDGREATVTGWLWDALAWNCDLPGRAHSLTLKLENDRW